MKKLLLFCLLFSSFILCRNASAETIVVAYPAVKEPYQAVFELINKGIKENASHTIKTIEFPQRIGSQALLQQLQELDADAAILLGGFGFKYAHDIVKHLPVMVGGYPIKPNGFGG
ncbi:hypothetical protein [Catenovulum sediminis]|uniref:hypothetical protein n=1 Tax=Catenovulum sediminis TaxID=1740262 RepID=UPI00117FF3BE|nr:hypothetical protein [Catenovulum sediminis]